MGYRQRVLTEQNNAIAAAENKKKATKKKPAAKRKPAAKKKPATEPVDTGTQGAEKAAQTDGIAGDRSDTGEEE